MGRPKGRKNSPEVKWCLFRSNDLLREVLRNEIKERELHMADVAKACGSAINKLYGYLNGYPDRLTQFQLLRLCEFLNVEVDIKINFNGRNG